jgi:DNA repair protein RecO (recombination protein O)
MAVIETATRNHLAALMTGDWVLLEASAENTSLSASGIVAAYSRWHIERGLKSLEHVER